MKVRASIHHLIILLLGSLTLTPVVAEMDAPILAFLRSCTPQVRNPTPEPTVGKRSPGEYETLVTKAINRFGLKLYANLDKEC